LSTHDDRTDGIVISSPSTISKNPKYKGMIEVAKIAKKERDIKNRGFGITGNIELDYLQLKEDFEVLKYKYNSLLHAKQCLDLIIKKAELNDGDLNEPSKQSILFSAEYKKDEVFKHIIELLLKDYHLIVTPSKNGKQGFVSYVNIDGDSIRICSIEHIEKHGITMNSKRG
jgi:hypothetical protein